MALISVQSNTADNTILIFDNFYNKAISISADQFNIVNAYFLGVCATKQIANNFTSFLFQVAKRAGIDALTLLQEIQGENNKLKVDQKLAYYLNSFKSKTSLYGVAVVPRPVVPVQRNIVN